METNKTMHPINMNALNDLMTSKKCHQCKYTFLNSIIDSPGHFNEEAISHVKSTHGIPEDTYIQWLYGYLYNFERTLTGIRVS
jgi:hypothetical protein